MKKLLISSIALLGLVLAGCSSHSSSSNSKSLSVGILQVVQHGSLDEARQGFKAGLNQQLKAHDKSTKVTYHYLNAQGDQANLNTMSQQLVQQKNDLLVGIATPAAQALAKKTTTTPTLVTAVTDLKSAGLVKSNQQPNTNVSGTSDLTPVGLQLKLLASMSKGNKPLGIMYNSSEENSVLQVNLAKAYAKKHNLKLKVVSATSTNDVTSVLAGLTGKVSGLYLPTDNLMASAMKTIGQKAKTAKLPVVTGSIEMAEDGGTATYGINYYDLGKQTGKMAYDVLVNHKKPQSMAVETSKKLHLYVNKANANSIGLATNQIKQP
ncbi:ABC transporter substrate-binding protein [Levilactobacillus brevis]|uniref:ABC transporter substrate-binding protein n=1 Tax=Levilactobacillus brevis TaxID=1580 RepID=A0AAJ5FNV2_LEVBR|nr:ABC transporter substrate-binding protein [Levilactobacillus brevis]AWP47121.1 ABC transporter substrate-binding protein [Levilactobacillus brevis]KIR09740.1 ABC transporter substrate-binding protein [Levilactobacillus brevis]RAY10380.1 ABC transporter substrate-binding protein [Levilactobacillus brevis]TOZ05064.1 ABC transporter substrate-binding protein [Levilactobacillus brevis]